MQQERYLQIFLNLERVFETNLGRLGHIILVKESDYDKGKSGMYSTVFSTISYERRVCGCVGFEICKTIYRYGK